MRWSGLTGLALQQSFVERKVVILQVFAKNEEGGYIYTKPRGKAFGTIKEVTYLLKVV